MVQEANTQARVVKRYRNRKLYDTQNSCYVTLEEIAEMIRTGDDVKVVDNRSGEDLTTITLTQIIFEEEKKNKKLLPLYALRKVIQSGGESLAQLLQKPINTINTAVNSITNVRDEAEKVIDKIKDEIEDSSQFVRDFLNKAHKNVDALSHKVEEAFKNPLQWNLHLKPGALKEEIRALRKKLATLERKVKKHPQNGKKS
ncbi:MAG: hypothetical protein KDK66_00625 [Deltaproteobacteria bacterium]|nr:hypothetical protein [Deltaproteobacteria bacterium]